MKAKQILENSAKKNMIQWNQEDFNKSHPKLYKTIIEAINQALIIDSVVSSAYMVKVEGNGTMIILAKSIADACDKLEANGYKNYTFVKSTSLDVLY